MNKLIEAQLNSVQFADLSHFDPVKNEYLIPKRSDIKLEKNKSYILELSDKCFDKDSIININWNKGRVPNSKYYKADILDIGKIVHINGLGYDKDNDKNLNIFWDGYVSLNLINIIKEL